jgi:arylsulfatase A-like enzyme
MVSQPRLAATARAALRYLDELEADRRFFLFLHTYHVHAPYEPDADDLALTRSAGGGGQVGDRLSSRVLEELNRDGAVSAGDLAAVRALYQAEIRGMDRDLAVLLDGLRQRSLLETSVLVLLSDHGEELGERGRAGWHSHSLYDELLRVPLVVRLPGARAAGKRVERMVGLIDVAPTLLDLVDWPVPASFRGTSLVALLDDPATAHRDAILASRDEVGSEPLRAVRTTRWKLIGDELFDLAADPQELVDVSPQHPDVVVQLRALLEAEGQAEAGPAVELDPELERQLGALGYL